ncbi:hypothetical protein FHS31_000786 [Sphingomonas vulcanisoli]|uniref:Uncharacterized protein n=1 Tax=Sphingomonas vulcanisoli TaxID=1658060 RepID=A0ABX0TRM6_9SPHN|nr:hypothetical protein [Sphingomonas vulcanisoli]NIJ07190.1 hypothetical protein [Sphingomonas vulcanisoli]
MTQETIEIAGVEVAVVSQEECEAAEMVVCVRKGAFSPFADNVEAPCAWCGETVIFRPYAPIKPPKVCMQCVADRFLGETQ